MENYFNMTIEFEKYFQLYFSKVEFESLQYFNKIKVEDSNYIKGHVSITIPPSMSYSDQDYLEQVAGVIKNEIQQQYTFRRIYVPFCGGFRSNRSSFKLNYFGF